MSTAQILIVEDEGIVARDLMKRLESAGYAVVGTVASGEDALRSVAETPPDLVLMDIHLETELDGIQTAERLTAEYGIPIVYLTAHSDEATFRRLLQTNPLGYLIKPFEERSLTNSIEMALYRSRVERELRESREELERFFALSLDMLCIVDYDGNFIRLNRAWRQFGYAEEDLSGQPVLQFLHPDDVHLLDDAARIVRKGQKEKTSVESRFRHADGTFRRLMWSVSAIPERRLYYVSAHDVTILREQHGQAVALSSRLAEGLMRQKRDLERSNEELRQFAYVASHVLKEPLRTISRHIQLLERQLRDALTPKAKRTMDFVSDAAKRVHEMIEALLDYSEINKSDLNLAPTDCDALLDSVLRNLSTEIADANAMITRDPLPTVIADAKLLKEVFCRLLQNALYYRGETPAQIRVSAAREGNSWVFSVRDNGVGIRTEHLDRILLMFQRLHHGNEVPGAGIGLPICRRVIERHGGEFWAESAPGCGSTFFFSLPAEGQPNP